MVSFSKVKLIFLPLNIPGRKTRNKPSEEPCPRISIAFPLSIVTYLNTAFAFLFVCLLFLPS